MTVYLICFERPYAHARHFAEDLEARLAQHRRGAGARLLQVIAQAGIGWRLARTWEGGDRALERRLKRQHHGPRLCPVCSPRAGRLRPASGAPHTPATDARAA